VVEALGDLLCGRVDSGESDVFVKTLHGESEVVVCHMSVFAVMFLHIRLCVRCARLQNVIV